MWLFLYRLWRLVGGSFLGRNLGPKAGSTSQAGCSTSWAKELSEALKLRPICSALEQLSAQDWVQASATGGPVRSAQFQSWKNSRKVNKKSKNDNKVCEKRDFSRQNEIVCFSCEFCIWRKNSVFLCEFRRRRLKQRRRWKNEIFKVRTRKILNIFTRHGAIIRSFVCFDVKFDTFWRVVWIANNHVEARDRILQCERGISLRNETNL